MANIRSAFDEFKFNAYMLSRYRDDYRADGSFDVSCKALIEKAQKSFKDEGGIEFLSEMLKQGELYQEMDKAHCPILIYVGDPICYGVLDHFATSLGYALDAMGELVEFFDPNGDNLKYISKYAGKRYRAIVGVQTFVFSVELKDGSNLHDLFIGPKFNMLFDHPVWLKQHLTAGPKDYYVLTHDYNYIDFTKTYYDRIKGVYLLPPAGDEYIPKSKKEQKYGVEKDLDITFIGSYHDYRKWEKEKEAADTNTGGIASKFADHMTANPNETWEEGLAKTLEEIPGAREKYPVGSVAFRDLLFEVKPVCFMVMSYFREKLLDEIAASGIEMHVFGDSFNTGRYKDVKTFIRHPELKPEEATRIYARSKVSLNIMSWHKAGMTERIAIMMLNKAVCVTDDSQYLAENYMQGNDYVVFDITKPKELPEILKGLLEDPERMKKISDIAYEKASIKEVWKRRAEELLRIIKRTESTK